MSIITELIRRVEELERKVHEIDLRTGSMVKLGPKHPGPDPEALREAFEKVLKRKEDG